MKKNTLLQICLPASASIMDAIECLSKSRKGVVLISESDGRFYGTITDADVRRGLASHMGLSDSVISIANNKPVTLPQDTTQQEIVQRFDETKLRAIPVIDKKNVAVDCLFLDDFMVFSQPQLVMMIMAGGFGKRMGQLTKNTPKPMLEVNGKPMIAHIIEQAASENFQKIYIATHYLGDQIQRYLGDGQEFNIPIEYIEENVPLNTGGSFANIPISQGPIVVTNSDVLTDVGYSKMVNFHLLQNAKATIAAHEHVIQHPFGVIRSDGIDFHGLEEKPKWVTNVNAGIYVLDASVRSLIKDREAISMPNLLQRAKNSGESVVMFPLHEFWTDLGTIAQYEKINS